MTRTAKNRVIAVGIAALVLLGAGVYSLASAGKSGPVPVDPSTPRHNQLGVRVPGPNGDYMLTDEEKRQGEADLDAYRKEMGLPPIDRSGR